MNEERTGPVVQRLLQALRAEAARLEPDVRVGASELTRVELLSARLAAWSKASRPQFSPEILLAALRENLGTFSSQVRLHDVGTVLRIGNGVATLSGLPRAATNELVEFPTGVQGLILNLEHQHIDVILLGANEGIQGGDLVTRTGERLRVPVGHSLLGRVVNPLGEPLDSRGELAATEYRFLERAAPGIVARTPIAEPLQTGIKIIDALVPLGRGQRELLVGDRRTGKTSLAVDAILNQGADSGVSCIYVAVGQKKSSTLRVIETLRASGALEYTTVVLSSPNDPPALRYLAPYAGCTMAEFLMYQGRDVLIVYDDLSKHADAYRELSLLLRRPPGREAYPGDIFYLHSRLLERAAKLNRQAGGGSITALPIVETQRGNLAAYIPTNLISITDGQIVVETELFNRGIKPAINAGRSVSRVGGKAQTAVMRELAGPLRLELSQFEEVARFARIGTEVDAATQQQIRRGERLQRVLTQPVHRPLSLAEQVVMLLAATEGYLDKVPLANVRDFELAVLAQARKEIPATIAALNRTGQLTDEMRTEIRGVLDKQKMAVWLVVEPEVI
ncbi:MAG TPA: F0F1 ATP synthase subunit alpha [Thermoflexia bacterium]|nr:F0F1 ATP synthase subunit alpha [Thermoflexia bacterium]